MGAVMALDSFTPAITAAAEQAYQDWGYLLDAGRHIEFVAHIIADHQPKEPRKLGGLTLRQKQVVDFVSTFSDVNGISPSFDEIREHLGLRSKSGVHRVVQCLVERGVIEFIPNRARAIIVRPEWRPAASSPPSP